MAYHCIPDGFRNNEAESRPGGRDVGRIAHGAIGIRTHGIARMHDDGASALPATALHRPPKLRRRCELVVGWQHDLCGQLCAALLAASGHNCTTGAGAHASAETVLTCTATVVRLERALTLCHVNSP